MSLFSLFPAEEIGFYGERLVGISEFTTDVRSYDVCTTTLDVGEFHTMVKIGKYLKLRRPRILNIWARGYNAFLSQLS